MKIHPQIISDKGEPAFVVLPYAEYELIIQTLENIEDIEAIEIASENTSERFPLELVEKIASGENAIKVFRDYRGLSQVELANRAGVSRQYMSQIESGERIGTARLLKKIATALSIDLDDIT